MRIFSLIRMLWNNFKWQVMWGFNFFLLISGVSVSLNYYQYKFINPFLCLISVLVFGMAVAANGKIIALVSTAGWANDIKNPKQGIESGLLLWRSFVQRVLLAMAIFYAFTSIVPLDRNIMAVPYVYLAIFTLFLIDLEWGIKTTIAKRFIYLFIVATFLVSFASMIGGEKYRNFLGFDPFLWSRYSAPGDQAYDNIANYLEEQKAKQREAMLVQIDKKLRVGQELTDEEKEFLGQEQRRMSQKGVAGLYKKTSEVARDFLKDEPAIASSLPPRDIPWMTFVVTKEPQELFTAHSGDVVEYFAPHPFQTVGEDGNVYYRNPSYNDISREYEVFAAKPGGEKIKIWSDKGPFQLRFRVMNQG